MIDALVLGALLDDEAVRIELHLVDCANCQVILRAAQEIARRLRLAVRTIAPSPSLRRQLQAAIQHDLEPHAASEL